MQFLQQESKQTFPENLKFKKRHYHFQMEVVDYSLKTKKINLSPIKLDQNNDLKEAKSGNFGGKSGKICRLQSYIWRKIGNFLSKLWTRVAPKVAILGL